MCRSVHLSLVMRAQRHRSKSLWSCSLLLLRMGLEGTSVLWRCCCGKCELLLQQS